MARSTYRPDHNGFRQFAREPFIGQAAVDAGRAVAAWAQGSDPGGEYVVQEAGVTGGRDNSFRAGAMVTETVRDKGPFKRSLARAAEQARS